MTRTAEEALAYELVQDLSSKPWFEHYQELAEAFRKYGEERRMAGLDEAVQIINEAAIDCNADAATVEGIVADIRALKAK